MNGYKDGHNKEKFHVFKKHPELQRFYASGYERGERDNSLREELHRRPGGVLWDSSDDEGARRSLLRRATATVRLFFSLLRRFGFAVSGALVLFCFALISWIFGDTEAAIIGFVAAGAAAWIYLAMENT
jgi:hypothetical protein